MRRKCKLTKIAKSQQQKFFRLCGEKYRRKLIGKDKMTVADFANITLILSYLDFSSYYSYVLCKYPEQLEICANVIDREVADDEPLYVDDILDENEIIIKRFCDGIQNKRIQKIYRERLFV